MILRNILKGMIKDKLRNAKTAAPDDKPRAAIIFGAGATPGIGAAIAQRVALGGLHVFVTGRNLEKVQSTADAINRNGGHATAIQVDATDADQIAAAFKQLDDAGFVVDLVIHNVGTNRHAKFLDITADKLERSWRADCLSGFLIGQQAIERMQPNGRGTLLFTGASASLRGKAGFALFATAKAGLRSLAQSMAREYGPKGIHVAHIIVDGMVDGDRLQNFIPQVLDKLGKDGSLNPEAIAETYWHVYQQHRTTWTHELEVRPFKENW